MKAFLLSVKNTVISVIVAAYEVALILTAALVVAGVFAYYYIMYKVRGAIRWIADKYRGFMAKFKAEEVELLCYTL